MKTTSIKVEGQIISPEIFDRFDSDDIKGQAPKDFGFEKGTKVKDEIARAWADAKDQWNIFKRHTENLPEDATGTSETRRYWIIPFLENLGYDLIVSKAEVVNDKSYAISHRSKNIDGFPVHIISFKDNLDKRREAGGARLSPHALVQDYLNLTEHLYAIVTNGYQLRLLRDSGKLIRLTYLEFDLLQMLEDDLYAEFAIMYRLIHSSRMPKKYDEGDESLIENYHQDSLESGARIREGLSSAVENSIHLIANGFLKHNDNDELRNLIRENSISSNHFYQYLLRFIYRILFLLVIEERDIIYSSVTGKPELQKLKDIYYKYYSITRLRNLAEEIYLFDEKLEDLWIALRNTFKIFGSEKLAGKLGIYPLDGDLFDYSALGILSDSNLDNRTLLECIKNLCVFENKQTRSVIRVNYAALNVEEFGSVYEGLLEKDPQITDSGNEISFSFVGGTERSSSGSHYTPEELVQPLIKHSLDYVIEDKLKNVIAKSEATKQSANEIREKQAEALLSIKVCDVACGSGHILLAAARKIALELSRVRHDEEQPSPANYRAAERDVINNCIYGVDKNPLAVELCKVALWLEAHNPGMPLNFLDHKIKCGDSIVGLARIEELQNGIATEAFKTMPGDDKEIAAAFRKQNKTDISNRSQYTLTDREEVIEKLNNISVKFKSFNSLPDNTVEAVKKKAEEFDVLKGEDWWALKQVADLQVAQFFIPKTPEYKDFLVTDREYFRIFAGERAKHERQLSTARAVAAEKRFFHWFLEFPEVFATSEHPEQSERSIGGFDCILGNPPFLGGQAISGTFGINYYNFIKTKYQMNGSCDVVTYFFKRVYYILKNNGFQSLISTNTISQGATRENGLEVILNNGGSINHAIKSMTWPGRAAVIVSLVTIFKGKWLRKYLLNRKPVAKISSYLEDEEIKMPVYLLYRNKNISFMGSTVFGKGFYIKNSETAQLLNNKKNKEVLFPILNGEDFLNDIQQKPSRWVINFFDWDEEIAKEYDDCYKIVLERVKSQRMNQKIKSAKEKWWQFHRLAKNLYIEKKNLKRVLVTAITTKTFAFSFVEDEIVFSNAIIVFMLEQSKYFSLIQSNFHALWAWKYASTLKTDLRYTPTDCFENFPFPPNLSKETEEELEKIGEEHHEFRRQLMLDLQLGLTKTYNLFHNPECNSNNIEKAKEIREFRSANLQIPIEEAIQRIEKLRALHKQMDETVLKAYGWHKDSSVTLFPQNDSKKGNVILSDSEESQTPIDLKHNFYEVDYLPENDRTRYTISPDARKEILKRLLELNHKIHEEEVKAGLWEKKGKKKVKTSVNKEQGGLFGE